MQPWQRARVETSRPVDTWIRVSVLTVVLSVQEQCLSSIAEDLQHYLRFLSAQPDPEGWLGTSLRPSLQELLQVHQNPLNGPLCSFQITNHLSPTELLRLGL